MTTQLVPHNSSEPQFGLALGGGGARGIAHILVFEALDELGVKPAIIAGTSIGAIMGYPYAAGMSGAEIREHCLEVLASRRAVFARLMSKWPGNITSLINPMTPSIFNGETVLDIVLPENLPKTFEELPIPLKAVTTDFYKHEELVIDKGEILPAVTASATLPAVFQPVEYEDHILIDGGFTNPLPYDHVTEGTQFTIAIDVNGQPRKRKKKEGLPGSWEVGMGVTQIIMASLLKEKLRHTQPDILIAPQVGEYLVLDFLKIQEILEVCTPIKDQVKQDVTRLIEKVPG